MNLARWSEIMLDASVKSAAIFAAAAAIAWTMRRASAAARHWVWLAAAATALLLPAFSASLPHWVAPVLPAKTVTTPVASILVQAPPIIPDRPPMVVGLPPPAPMFQTPMQGPPPQAPMDWRSTVLTIWLIGCASVLAIWGVGIIRLWQLAHASRPGEDHILEIVKEQCARLSIRRRVRLRILSTTVMPLAWGLARPTVLLPAEAAEWPLARLRAVLLHELGHIARWDAATQAIGQFATAVYWFNPLAWLAARRLRIERERACDDLVLKHGVPAASYAGDLLEVARSLRSPLLTHTAGLAMARPSGLRRRVMAILDGGINRRTLSRRMAMAVLAAALVVMAPMSALRLGERHSQARAADARAADAPTAPHATGTFALTVIDEATQHPIPGAKVSTASQGSNSDTTTDANGRASLHLPEGEFPRFVVMVSHDGYAGKLLQWRGLAAGEHEAIPAAYTLALPKGTTLSGKVVDQAGKPVADAHVRLWITGDNQPNPHEQIYVPSASATTDREGNWHFDDAPAHFQNVSIGAWSYEHLTGTFYDMHPVPNLQSLRDGSATITLPRAVTVKGIILGPDGNPAAGATVGIGADRVATNVVPEMNADSHGRFSMGVEPDTQVCLTFQAPGCAPEIEQFALAEDAKELTVHLSKAHTLTGLVLDSAGKPVAKAYVWLDTWRGLRTLNKALWTDSAGKFSWNQAPADEVYADVEGPGLLRVNDVKLQTGAENFVQLQPLLHVTGTVTDSQSGEPIKSFNVIHGISWSVGPTIHWERRNGITPGAEGKFEYTESYPYPGCTIRIEADGYMPADSRLFKPEEGQVSFDFNLQKAPAKELRVFNPDGSPAAGAKVVMSSGTANAGIFFTAYDQPENPEVQQFTADNQGRVKIPPQLDPTVLAIYTPGGFLAMSQDDVAAAKDVHLAAWATVEGTVTVGGNPRAGEPVAMESNANNLAFPNLTPRVRWRMTTMTDANGHYVFERVAPEEIFIGRYLQQRAGPAYVGQFVEPQSLTVAAGKRVHEDLGDNGRLIVGKLHAPAELAARNDWSFFYGAEAVRQQPYLDFPVPKDLSSAGVMVWVRQFAQTDAGKAQETAIYKESLSRREYPLVFAPDGTFKIEDVAPGTYAINAMAQRRPAGDFGVLGELLAEGNKRFDVSAGPVDTPVDIGAIDLQMVNFIGVGKPAPEFTIPSLDGKNVSLSSLRGKYVLLDFWATWNASCRHQVSSLKQAYDAYGKNPLIAFVSISLDEKADDVRKYAVDRGMAWTQLFQPGAWDQPVLKAYGVRSLPSVWLIGPDGKIVAMDLDGDGIRQAISAALGQ